MHIYHKQNITQSYRNSSHPETSSLMQLPLELIQTMNLQCNIFSCIFITIIIILLPVFISYSHTSCMFYSLINLLYKLSTVFIFSSPYNIDILHHV